MLVPILITITVVSYIVAIYCKHREEKKYEQRQKDLRKRAQRSVKY